MCRAIYGFNLYDLCAVKCTAITNVYSKKEEFMSSFKKGNTQNTFYIALIILYLLSRSTTYTKGFGNKYNEDNIKQTITEKQLRIHCKKQIRYSR